MTYNFHVGLQTNRSRKLFLIGATLVLGVALAMAAIMKPASAEAVVTVRPSDQQGWTTAAPADNRPGGAVTYTSAYGAPVGFGAGSLKLETTTGTAKAQYYHQAGNELLASIEELSYSTYRSVGSASQLPAINLVIDFNGDATGGFSTLVYEPVYQPDVVVQNGVWQAWDASGEAIWWSTKAMPGGINAFTSYVSLQDIVAANPDAVVKAYIINQGSGNPGLVAGVDAFNFNGTVYDFEENLVAPTDKQQCMDGAWATDFQTIYKNQGTCVSSVVANDNASFKRQ